MANLYGPRIVTDGLICYLDAANRKSYPGSGSTWYDLSGNGHNATIVGSSVWNTIYGGQFDFGNLAQISQYIILPHAAAQSTGSYYTMDFWMKPIISATRYFCSMASSNVDNNYFLLQHNSDGTIQRNAGAGVISYSNNEILQFCIVRNNSNTGLFYKNGTYITTSTNITTINNVANGGWILNQEQDIVGGAFDNTQNYRGAFMCVKLYDRALSGDEIRQNYNALKGRFGL